MSDGRSALPQGWRELRLKFLASVQTGMAKGKDLAGTETVEVPYLRVANVQDGYLDLNDVATMAVPTADLDRYRLQIGDVLMNEGGDFDKLGRGHVWHGQIDPCIHQNHVFAVRPHGVTPEWLNAYTGSAPAQFYFMGRSKQSTNLASISSSNLMELPVPVPPVAVQHQLLAYLDRETARIDALIEKKNRFIELLREKQEAVTRQAVSRGCVANRPLRQSGVAWLGDIPAEWHVAALGYLAVINSGSTPDRSVTAFWGGDVPWVKTGEIDYKTINTTDEHITQEGLRSSAARLAEPGTLLMAMYGQGVTRGRVALLGIAAAYNQACAAICFGREIRPAFGRYFFIAAYKHIRDSGNETSQMNLSVDHIQKFKLIVPPVEEQDEIVAFLDGETQKLESLQEAVARSMDILRERRAALITAAVTGQIDLRAELPASALEPA